MSVLAINNNTLAYNAANALQGHYSRLATSTERLSTGLRINSAADDAAGLAIRELMRADITALRQGARNVNDAISMLQTTDGALSVIDEKLIRMKELAEQAATGTYDSTQRLMIASEFQAMGDEINRIARATDFNGIKLLDGQATGAPVVINASGIAVANAQAGRISMPVGNKTFDVTTTGVNDNILWPGATATPLGDWDLSGITDPEALAGITNIEISNNNIPKIGNNFLLVTPTNSTSNIPPGTSLDISFNYIGMDTSVNPPVAMGSWYVGVNGATPTRATYGDGGGFTWSDPAGTGIHIQTMIVDANGTQVSVTQNTTATWTSPTTIPSFSSNVGTVTSNLNGNQLDMSIDLGGGNSISRSWNLGYGANTYEPSTVLAGASLSLNVRDTTPVPPNPGPDPGPDPVRPPYNGDDPNSPLDPDYFIPDDVVRIHFGPGADSREDFYDIRKHDATLKGLGLDGVTIQTQDDAQNALVSIRDAIVAKDKIRAEYGAMQNRLENTLTNVTVQAENLQAAESRLSDVNVATEMSNFVRNQVLTQSALAMLSQANSMPQMVMSLIR